MSPKYLKEVSAVVERYWSDWSLVTTGGKHPRFVLRLRGHECFVTFAGSPSDHRHTKNFERDLRRVIRKLKEQAA